MSVTFKVIFPARNPHPVMVIDPLVPFETVKTREVVSLSVRFVNLRSLCPTVTSLPI
jgi:hypothetical protein